MDYTIFETSERCRRHGQFESDCDFGPDFDHAPKCLGRFHAKVHHIDFFAAFEGHLAVGCYGSPAIVRLPLAFTLKLPPEGLMLSISESWKEILGYSSAFKAS